MIKALFLDMDHTLTDTSGADSACKPDFQNFLEKEYGIAEKSAAAYIEGYFLGIYRRDPKVNNAIAAVDEEDFRKQLVAMLVSEHGLEDYLDSGKQLAVYQAFEDMRYAKFRFFPGVDECLRQLRESYTLVLITNGPALSQRRKVAETNLQEYVDHILVGGEQPEQKPHASIFQTALRLAGCEAHEAIHIGDSEKSDIEGAKGAGMQAVRISTELGVPTIADATLEEFTKLPEYLESL